jgi:hypothetical protein
VKSIAAALGGRRRLMTIALAPATLVSGAVLFLGRIVDPSS